MSRLKPQRRGGGVCAHPTKNKNDGLLELYSVLESSEKFGRVCVLGKHRVSLPRRTEGVKAKSKNIVTQMYATQSKKNTCDAEAVPGGNYF